VVTGRLADAARSSAGFFRKRLPNVSDGVRIVFRAMERQTESAVELAKVP